MWRFASVLWMCLGLSVSPVLGGSAIPVADINPGPGGGGASGLTVYDGKLYFSANDVPHGNDVELWRYDGVTTERVVDIKPGTDGSNPSGLTVYNGKLYFGASGASGPTRLYQCDGTSASAVSTEFQGPGELTVFNGTLFFSGTDYLVPKTGTELWKFNGSTPPVLIELVPGEGSSGPKEFVEYDGAFYFNAVNQELWKLNAAADGAAQVTDIANGQGSSPEHPVVFNNDIYFSAYDHVNGRELWRYNAGAPVMVANIWPGGQYDSGNPSQMTVYNGAIYFVADNGVDGAELWRHDGTVTEMVANINPTPFVPGVDPVHHSWPMDFFVFNGLLYFAADDGVHGRELWSYDGTTASLVADIYPGEYGSSVGGFAVYNGQLYFSANDGQLGGELYTYNDPVGLFMLPEPATVSLLVLGGAALLRRRRRRRRV